ncbi:MAG: lysophospholipase [Lachnospiraceae bacterium]|nr:lysophospholipase [Lachnospiraceae bacterium]
MYKHEEFYYDSRDMKHKIHADKFIPEKDIRAILIIVHGMGEHMGRYAEMCKFFAEEHILVAGCDHLGHGKTAEAENEFGFFTEQDPATVVVRDVHRLKKLVQQDYPELPVFICGHSMGSFIVRNYIQMYGSGVDAAFLMGSGDVEPSKLHVGKFLISMIAAVKGGNYVSRMCTALSLQDYDKNPDSDEYPFQWGCSRAEVREAEKNDPLSGHEFTVNGYYALADFLIRANDKNRIDKIPKDLPIWFMSGAQDPVGGYGKFIEKAAEKYKDRGLTDVSVTIYPNDRHELYNEPNRFDIFIDMLKYMGKHGMK